MEYRKFAEIPEKVSLLGFGGMRFPFKAVKNGDVWCTTNDMYQQSMSMGYLMQDIHSMLLGENEQKMKYLFQLK